MSIDRWQGSAKGRNRAVRHGGIVYTVATAGAAGPDIQAQTRATLEAINLFLDLPGVCFYIGLDWERLTAVLEQAFGDRAEAFMEKIVQVAIDLPPRPGLY